MTMENHVIPQQKISFIHVHSLAENLITPSSSNKKVASTLFFDTLRSIDQICNSRINRKTNDHIFSALE